MLGQTEIVVARQGQLLSQAEFGLIAASVALQVQPSRAFVPIGLVALELVVVVVVVDIEAALVVVEELAVEVVAPLEHFAQAAALSFLVVVEATLRPELVVVVVDTEAALVVEAELHPVHFALVVALFVRVVVAVEATLRLELVSVVDTEIALVVEVEAEPHQVQLLQAVALFVLVVVEVTLQPELVL